MEVETDDSLGIVRRRERPKIIYALSYTYSMNW